MRIAYLFFLFALPLFAKETVCLNMIVKNECKVIERCLSSVLPVIDYWVIVDTGSTDGTQEIIKAFLKDKPGELYERPWKNFGESRSEALELAKGKCEYILFMDADDTLEFEDEPSFGELTEDLYYMWRGSDDFNYIKPQLVRSSLPCSWIGVTHEYLNCPVPCTSQTLEFVKYRTWDGGARAGSRKFFENIRLLEDGLKKEPHNERYAFYLAESYRDAGEKGKALECFQKRIKMGGWDEEIYWSKLQIALMLQDMGVAHSIVCEAFLDAHNFRPHRCEALYYLIECYHNQGNYQLAYALLKAKDNISKPSQRDYLFNMNWIETYGFTFQLSICAYYVGNYEESLEACDELLSLKEKIPANWYNQAKNNREFPLAKIKELAIDAVQSPEPELSTGMSKGTFTGFFNMDTAKLACGVFSNFCIMNLLSFP